MYVTFGGVQESEIGKQLNRFRELRDSYQITAGQRRLKAGIDISAVGVSYISYRRRSLCERRGMHMHYPKQQCYGSDLQLSKLHSNWVDEISTSS